MDQRADMKFLFESGSIRCELTYNKRQVEKSDRINSDRQSGWDQLGSTRTNSDRRKKNKIKLDSDQLGS